MRIGLLGGTFNPVHLGHLLLAEHARTAHQLDEVWLLPNQVPPHRRPDPQLAGAHDRYVMVCMAAAGNPALIPCHLELDFDEVSYTVHTMERLTTSRPQDRFTFISGADSLSKDNWFRLDDLLGMVEHFVVASRSGHQLEGLAERLASYQLQHGGRIQPLVIPTIDISSTEIRRRVHEHSSITYMVPAAVEDYIRKMGLYR